jgi:hypothetical protein
LAVQKAAEGFTPVAPSSAIQVALQCNVKIVRDWLDQKDYASAVQSVQTLGGLVQLYSYQTSDPAWRERTTALRDAFGRITASAKGKDAAGTKKALQECEALLREMAQNPPQGSRGPDASFKPVGNQAQWMRLLDGTYVDAKSTDDLKELENLAYALAEEANAVQFLRADAKWRQQAADVRKAALETAATAQKGSLAPARAALKGVYQHCQACHDSTRKQ